MPTIRNVLQLYATEQDRENAQKLFRQLEQRGITLTDNRGNTSYSALFRYLIAEKLKCLGEKELKP